MNEKRWTVTGSRWFAGCCMMGLVLAAGCLSSPERRIQKAPEVFAAFPPDVQAKVRKGEVDIGFTPDMVIGLYVGFDQPQSLGGSETGGSTAVPIFQQIITEALKGTPARPFRVPPGLRLVRVDPESGRPAEPGNRKAILEAFLPGTEPGAEPEPVLGGNLGPAEFQTPAGPTGTGGLY